MSRLWHSAGFIFREDYARQRDDCVCQLLLYVVMASTPTTGIRSHSHCKTYTSSGLQHTSKAAQGHRTSSQSARHHWYRKERSVSRVRSIVGCFNILGSWLEASYLPACVCGRLGALTTTWAHTIARRGASKLCSASQRRILAVKYPVSS